MSKSTGQIVGGVLGAVGGFFVGGPAGAVKGALIGSSIGGMIDPPPGPDLKGPTLEDKSFNSAAYGVSLATLHGTIAHTGSIIYLENNEYKAVAKKQKTGGKGGSPKGSYTTTTYYATFAVAVGEAMPGSEIRRIWAGGKLIYSMGFQASDESIEQSDLNSAGWAYYDGSQTEPDSRMEASLGVGNCPSYEGTAYIIFYDFELTDYGNGLQGCPIKVEVSQSGKGYEFYEGFETITLDSTIHAHEHTNGVSVATTSPSDVLEIKLSGVDNAWRISPTSGWRSWVSVVVDDDPDSRVNFGTMTEYSTKAEAQANFPVGATITGGTKYTFFFLDYPFDNNLGTMSFLVPSVRAVETVKKEPTLLSDIVAASIKKAGVAETFYDLAALDNEVFGYKITEVSSARGAIGPLQVAYLFDFIEDGYTLKAVKRGGGSIASIPLSKLGARGAGEAAGVRVIRDRETESQLPSRYSLTYIDYNREYDTNTQYQDYPSRASNEVNKQLPVVLTATEAAKLADVLINLAWVERFSYEFTLSQEFAFLKPSNVITVEVAAGAWVVLRISSITYSADQRIAISARRAEPAVYQSGAVGIAVTPPSENIPRITNANTVMMDLPAITDDVTNYGFGVAMYGSATWPGGALLRSIDTGQTYDAIQSYAANCTVAEAVSVLPAGEYFVIDRTSELTLTVLAGEFFSITESQMLTGKHYCAYGADGRWEIMQYATATVISGSSIKLSTFVRGLFGTEWAGDLHQAGDKVVLLDDPDTAFIGADAVALNAPRKFKGVTLGQDAQLLDEIDFTYRGTNLKPLSPVNVTGTLVSEVWTISCTTRTRMVSNQWATGIAAPMGEVALLFEFEIYDGPVFKKTYQSNTETFVYSSANQLADFGYLPTTLTVKIYQISAVIGRGFSVVKTLIGVGDIYGDYVTALLHGVGVDDSTVFLDSSKRNRVFSAVGNAKISTAQPGYSTSSMYFDGAGDAVMTPHVAGLDQFLADFTVRCRVYPAAVITASAHICSKGLKFGVSNPHWALTVNSSGNVLAQLGRSQSAISRNLITSTTALPANQWTDIEFVRTGSVLKLFINGVQEGGNVTVSITPLDSSNAGLWVGGYDGAPSESWYGYIQGFQSTNSVARHTSNFSIPTQQLPDPI